MKRAFEWDDAALQEPAKKLNRGKGMAGMQLENAR
jgi:hypothetical protein